MDDLSHIEHGGSLGFWGVFINEHCPPSKACYETNVQ